MKTGQPIAAVTKDDPKGFGLGVNTSTFGPDQTIWAYEGGTMSARVLYSYFPKHDLVIAGRSTVRPPPRTRSACSSPIVYVAATGDTAPSRRRRRSPRTESQ